MKALRHWLGSFTASAVGVAMLVGCSSGGSPQEEASPAEGALHGSSHMFDCGGDGLQCDRTKEYCLEKRGGMRRMDGESNESISCEQLPDECGSTPTCECIGTGCSGSAGSGLKQKITMQ